MHIDQWEGGNPLRFLQITLGYFELTVEANREKIESYCVENDKWDTHSPICEAWWKEDSPQPLATLVNWWTLVSVWGLKYMKVRKMQKKKKKKHLTVTLCAYVHSQMHVNTHIVHTHQNMHSFVQYIHIYTYNAKVHLLQLNILFQ